MPTTLSDHQLPLVSVIVPTYNRAALVAEAIDSVLAQTYPRLEVIVVDDGSSDDTRTVLQRYGDKISVVFMRHSGLSARARNAGIRVATGEFLAFLDSDDRWSAEKIERQMTVFAADDSLGLVCTNAAIIDPRGCRTGSLVHPHKIRGIEVYSLDVLARGNELINSAVMCKTAVVRHVGGFFESPSLTIGEDYDLWLRCATVAGVAYLCEPLVEYRIGSADQITTTDDYALREARSFLLIHDRARMYILAETSLPLPRYSFECLRRKALRQLLRASRGQATACELLRLRLKVFGANWRRLFMRREHGERRTRA